MLMPVDRTPLRLPVRMSDRRLHRRHRRPFSWWWLCCGYTAISWFILSQNMTTTRLRDGTKCVCRVVTLAIVICFY